MKETMIETVVTYTLEHDGKFFLIERVPARVTRDRGAVFRSRNRRAHSGADQEWTEARKVHRDPGAWFA